MSAEAIAWARKQTVGATGRKAMLLLLADIASEHGVLWAGRKYLAGILECQPATVSEYLARLAADGFIARVERRGSNGARKGMVTVLAPAGERGDMHDPADHELFGALVRESLGRDSLGRDSDPPRSGFHTPLGRDFRPEPLAEPSLEPKASSSSGNAREPWPGIADQMRVDADELLRRKLKVAGHLVTARELEVAAAALSEYNRQAQSDFGLGANLKSIVMRIRERPSWDAAAHVRLVQSAWRIKWWERNGNRRRPTPQVIYSERSFENVVQDAVDEKANRLQAPDSSLRDKVWPDGRRWDELTPREQANAKEAVLMGLRPWERREEDRPLVAVNGNGHGAYTAENFASDE